MKTLIEEDGYILYQIKNKKNTDAFTLFFDVFAVTSFTSDKKIKTKKLFLSGFVKWDGCSEFRFQEESIHLCGKRGYENFKNLLDAVYEYCSKNIKKWDDNNS